MNLFEVVRIGLLATVSFVVAILWTPLLTGVLYRYRCWKKTARTIAPDGSGTPLFNALHKDKEINTPRLGGLLIWVTAAGYYTLRIHNSGTRQFNDYVLTID